MSKSVKKARPIGRPSKYKPEYCEQVVQFCKQPGHTLEMFAEHIEVHTDTLQEWKREHADFSVAHKRARMVSKNAMMKVGMKGMVGQIKGFNTTAWIFWMKSVHGMSDFGPMDEQDNIDLGFVGDDDE